MGELLDRGVQHHFLQALGWHYPESCELEAGVLPRPLQGKPLQQIIHLQPRRLPPIEDHLDDLRREQSNPK